MSPTSTVPSTVPTISGSVVFVELSREVSSTISDEELSELISSAEETFGVQPGNVEAEVTYDVSGTIVLALEEDINEELLTSALQSSIANALNVHVSDVSVTIDPESGNAIYTISSADTLDAIDLQAMLYDPSTRSAIASELANDVPEVTVVT